MGAAAADVDGAAGVAEAEAVAGADMMVSN